MMQSDGSESAPTSFIVDPRLFSQSDLAWRKKLVAHCEGLSINVGLHTAPSRSVHATDAIALVGAGAGVAALLVAIIEMARAGLEAWSYERLESEVMSYLRLHGADPVKIRGVSGFEHLTGRDGEPCTVVVELSDGRLVRLHIGRKGQMLIASVARFDATAL